MRNVPLLLQLFFWYALITENMPGAAPGATNPCRACSSPSRRARSQPGRQRAGLDVLGLALAIVAIIVLGPLGRKRQEATGRIFPAGPRRHRPADRAAHRGLAGQGASLALDMPALQGLQLPGRPEHVALSSRALLAGLVIYTSAFVAEVVRSGIQAVNQGQ